MTGRDTIPRRASTWQFRHGNRGLVDVIHADEHEVTIRYRNTGHRSTTTRQSFVVMYDPHPAIPLADDILDSATVTR